MAIVRMKKLRVWALAGQRASLLRGLQSLGCVEISASADFPSEEEGLHSIEGETSAYEARLAEAETVLERLSAFSPKEKGGNHRTVPWESLHSREAAETGETCCKRIIEVAESLSQMRLQEETLTEEIRALLPWQSLELPLGTKGTKHVAFYCGTLPADISLSDLRAELETAEAAAELMEVYRDEEQGYCLLVCHQREEETVLELLRHKGFRPVFFQGRQETAAAEIGRLQQSLTENRRAQSEAEAKLTEEGDNRRSLELYADGLRMALLRERASEKLLGDEKILFLQGWLPAEREAEVTAFLSETGCAWETVSPSAEEFPAVPVALKNHMLTRPLNVVTQMYVLPAYDGIDPNPLMAPFFVTFYGLMMADMGYGLLMLLGAWVILRKRRADGTLRDFGGLLVLCGISTVIWGALTGSFFGDFLPQLCRLIDSDSTFRLPYLFTPLEDTLAILIGSLALGAVQVISGMVISVVWKVKAGRVMDAVWEEGTWWLILAGGVLAVLGVGNAGGVPVILSLGLALLLLGSLIRGKGFGKITGLIGAVYQGVTGYFSDILSYARLMALMLAGSVIAQVFNTLGAVTGNVIGFLIISLAGNLLNFALNLLGCYVHDLRLQCLEFFGRFYKEGGKAFQPLQAVTHYVDIQHRK